ncbi:hypothetical protein, conserved [Leishmania tarentolae]|uniref:Uncharacterized protein n=1 Tax=Leishmania tarentolae TaxID=5689 RepID=A0A640KNY7_LEITA|nr:hypothetical protein, conserved [Leishmania tarentolae]
MSSAAARKLQRLLDGYVSASLDGQERKLLPNGNNAYARNSHTLALDAADVMSCLPFFSSVFDAGGGSVASMRVLRSVPSQALMTETGLTTRSTADETRASDASSSFILYLGDVVEKHLHAFMLAVSVGPPFSTLHFAAELRCDNASEGRINKESRSHDCTMSERGCRGGGGPYVNFIAWVALEVYRLLARGAESRQRERRAPGGATSADAGVRTDAYTRWEREIGERVSAAVAAAQKPGTTGAGCNDVNWNDILRTISSALDKQLDDVFATSPHFFYLFMCTELLPDLQQRLHRCGDKLLVRLRELLRCTAASSHTPDEPLTHRTRSLPTALWTDTVSLLCGESTASSSLIGAEAAVRNESGFTAPATTPAQTSAFVAAAVASSLAAPLLRPACLWIDRIASFTCVAEAGSQVHPVVTDEQNLARAVMHIVDVCMRSVQVVPFPMYDGCDADMPLSLSGCEMAGAWLIPSTPSPLHVRPMPSFGLWRQRRAVVLPGLSIAATRIRSLDAAYSRKASTADAPTPDMSAPAGTCVWSPAGALAQVLWSETQVGSSAVSPCCDDTNALFTSVSAMPDSRLHPVELLLLFEDVPSDAEALARLRSALDVEVRKGWVVLAVQASVPKNTQQCVESTWGTDVRPVLLLSAVGQWGLQQLALRFNVQPNTSATDVNCLRGVRRRFWSQSGADQPQERRGCGFAALPLRGQQYAPSSSLSVDEAGQCQRRGKGNVRHTRYAAAFVERREHYLFVVGERTDAVEPSTCNTSSAIESERTTDRVAGPAEAGSQTLPAAGQLQLSPPPLSQPIISMYVRDDLAESSSTDSSDPRSFSSGSTFSDTTAAAVIAAYGSDEPVMQAWYADPAPPPIPFVVASVLVGAATRGAQQELVYDIGHQWRCLLHQLVLPEPLCCRVPTSGERGATAMAIRKLDSLLQPSLPKEVASSPAAGVPRVYTPEQLRVLGALRDALSSYELLSLQHGPEGRTLEDSWKVLQRYREPTTCPYERCTEVPAESWLVVQSAFLALADCLDELCHTVVLGGGGDASSNTGEAQDSTTRGLYFFPAI